MNGQVWLSGTDWINEWIKGRGEWVDERIEKYYVTYNIFNKKFLKIFTILTRNI